MIQYITPEGAALLAQEAVTQARTLVTETLAPVRAQAQSNTAQLSKLLTPLGSFATGVQAEAFVTPRYELGNVAGQRDFVVDAGTGVVTVNGLTVTAEVASAAPGVILRRKVAEGATRILVKAASVGWMIRLRLQRATGDSYAVWSAAGQNLETGRVVNAGQAMTVTSRFTAAGAVPQGTDFWVEVISGVPYVGPGGALLIYVWAVGAARPAAATLVYAFDATDILLPEGYVGFNSIGATPAQFGRVLFLDSQSAPNPISANLSLVGKWFSRFERGMNVLATLTQGSELRFTVNGATSVNLDYATPPGQTSAPRLAVSVDGGAYTSFLLPVLDTGTVRIADNLGAGAHTVRVVAAGIEENSGGKLWTQGIGLLVSGVRVNAGTISPTPLSGPSILGIGTSITAGIAMHGLPSTPTNSGGEKNFLHVACDQLGAVPVQSGYGGTGVTVSGSGGVPDARQSSRLWMNGRSGLPDADIIHIEHGTNDNGAGVTQAAFIAGVSELVDIVSTLYPNRPIVISQGLQGQYAAALQAFAQARGCFYFTPQAISTTDGTHPDDAGHLSWGGQLAGFLRGAFPGKFTA